MAQETQTLNWQPGLLRSDEHVLKANFTASSAHKSLQANPFEKPLLITTRPGQTLTVCGDQVSGYNDGGDIEPDLFIQNGPSRIVLTDWQTTLTIERPFPCPDYEVSHQPYHFRNVVRSDEPFMIVFEENPEKRQKSSGLNSGKGSIPITGLPFALPNPVSLLSGTGYGSGSDDDNFFKRPPHLPMMGKGDLSLTFLPFIRLPGQWQNQLPGWHWSHWIIGEPDAEAGVTVIIRFNQSAPVALHLTPWEYRQLAENMLNTRQLLQWLAYKLSGRESFIQVLLDITALVNEQEELDETLSAKLEEQLMVVLEQPDMDFSLEFEQHELHQTLFNASASPEQSIVQLPIGKVSGEQAGLPSGSNAESGATSSQQRGNHKSNLPPENRQQTGDNNRQPEQPSAPNRELLNEQNTVGYFELVVNDHTFRVKKNQLNPERRGQEDAKTIKAERSDLLFPLDQVEEIAGVPAIWQLANIESKTLKYLVTYGTESTRWALLDFYPASIISLQENHLAVDPGAVIPETALECSICQDALLTRENLVQTECRDILHPACLVHYLRALSRENREEPRCPVCRNGLPELMSVMGSDELLENQLRAAATRGDSTTVKGLLEAGVNADSTNREGNTALHLATETGHYHVAEQLVRYGAHPNTSNEAGITPIELAVVKGHSDIAEMLSEARKTPGIFFAVGHGRTDLLEVWLDDGEPVDIARQPDGLSLLHLAVKNNHPEIVSKLLVYARSLGIDITSQTDIHGRTALHYACDYGFTDIAANLIGHGSDVNLADHYGSTALMLAVIKRDVGSARLLLQNGANPFAQDRALRSPKTVAEVNGLDDILILMGAEIKPGNLVQRESPSISPIDLPQPVLSIQSRKAAEPLHDHYSLKIAQTTYKITGRDIQRKLRKTWALSLGGECQDCKKKIWYSLPGHSNQHIVSCHRCRQFTPPEGSLETRQAALKLHHQNCPRKPDSKLPQYAPQIKEDNDSTLALFFRFGNLTDNQQLLSKVSDEELVQALSIPNSRKKTPVHVLFQYGSEEFIHWFLTNKSQLLLANPGLLSQQDQSGWTPLHLLFYRSIPVTQKRFLHLYSTLLERNPLLLHSTTRDGWTLFHIIARYANQEVATLFFKLVKKQLQQNPLPLTWQNKQGWTFLHMLFFYGTPPIVMEFLQQFESVLSHGPKILNRRNSHGNTPVHFLASKAPFEIMQTFLEKSSEPELTSQRQMLIANQHGETPLHLLCLNNSLELVRQVLNRYKESFSFGMLTHAVSHKESELFPSSVSAWSLMDYLVQKAPPFLLAEWLKEHLEGAVSPEKLQLLLTSSKTWPEFSGEVVSDDELQANWLLQQIVRIYENPVQLPTLLSADEQQTAKQDICPITGELIQNKVVTNPCGHQFEQEALERWMVKPAAGLEGGGYRCPVCSESFSHFIKVYSD